MGAGPRLRSQRLAPPRAARPPLAIVATLGHPADEHHPCRASPRRTINDPEVRRPLEQRPEPGACGRHLKRAQQTAGADILPRRRTRSMAVPDTGAMSRSASFRHSDHDGSSSPARDRDRARGHVAGPRGEHERVRAVCAEVGQMTRPRVELGRPVGAGGLRRQGDRASRSCGSAGSQPNQGPWPGVPAHGHGCPCSERPAPEAASSREPALTSPRSSGSRQRGPTTTPGIDGRQGALQPVGSSVRRKGGAS
jgi:hypothetical protein